LTIIGLMAAALLACTQASAWADRGRDGRSYGAPQHQNRGSYYQDTRYQHNRSYPRPGYRVKSLPRGYHSVRHRHTRYYYSGGSWYRGSGVYFSVILPPVGLVVPTLPPFYTTVWYGPSPYYYAGGVYYTWYPPGRGYIVSEPPAETGLIADPEIPDQLFIYPKDRQGPEQQSSDRYECHRWAVDQTGFDPTQPGGNVPDSQNAARRADYNRASKACLEARNYSVQ
jgi:hypothetical protein